MSLCCCDIINTDSLSDQRKFWISQLCLDWNESEFGQFDGRRTYQVQRNLWADPEKRVG